MGNKNILDFYIAANQNKYEIAKLDVPRDYSVAEITTLACMDALFRYHIYKEDNKEYDVVKVIKMILLNSLYGKMDSLSRKDKYNSLVEELDNSHSEETIQAKKSIFNALTGFKDQSKGLNRLLKKYSKLQTLVRQGHKYWNAKGQRLESDLEHTYGTMIINLGLESEYNYDVDFDKVLIMLLIHETDEIIFGDPTEFDGISSEERLEMSKNAEKEVLGSEKNGSYFINLLSEFDHHNTIESLYAHLEDKLEYDLQVKMYDMQGRYDFENRPDNVVTRSSRVKKIIEDGADSVFLVHYYYDEPRYIKIPCLKGVLELTKKL